MGTPIDRAKEEMDLVERLRVGICVDRCRVMNTESGCECAEAADEIERLRGIISGDAGFLHAVAEGGGLDVGLTHPLVAVMADSLAQTVAGSNYVEMRMTHKQTGEEYTIHIQRLSRPTPHELRKRAEEKAEKLLAFAKKACDLDVSRGEALEVLRAVGVESVNG